HSLYRQGALAKKAGNRETARAKLEEAETTARKAVKLGESDAWCHYRLAQVLFELDRFQEALAPARQAVTIRPEETSIQTLLGSVLAELGRKDEALEHLRRGVACAGPDDNRASEALEKYRARFAKKKP